MDLEKELENLREACELQVNNSNEIVITSLDACRFIAGDHISVKTQDDDDDDEGRSSAGGNSGNNTLKNSKSAAASVIVNCEGDGHDLKGEKKMEEEVVIAEFSKEKDIPDIMSVKVYDFVMSKERTLPVSNSNLPNAFERRLQQKWFWIAGLAFSTLVLLIIILVVVFTYPPNDDDDNPNN